MLVNMHIQVKKTMLHQQCWIIQLHQTSFNIFIVFSFLEKPQVNFGCIRHLSTHFHSSIWMEAYLSSCWHVCNSCTSVVKIKLPFSQENKLPIQHIDGSLSQLWINKFRLKNIYRLKEDDTSTPLNIYICVRYFNNSNSGWSFLELVGHRNLR